MKKMILVGIVLLSSTVTIAQKNQNSLPVLIPENGTSKENVYSMKSWESIAGTYQFVISDENIKPLHNEELFNLIKNSRKEAEDLILELNTNIKIYIPSKQRLNSPEFTALEKVQYSNN
jgi:hypothetical protein